MVFYFFLLSKMPLPIFSNNSIVHFPSIKGVLMFTVVVLIGAGWSFVKPFVTDKEKKVILVVIPLQVIINIAAIVIDENIPALQGWLTWVRSAQA